MQSPTSPDSVRHCERHGDYVPQIHEFEDASLSPIVMGCQRCADEAAGATNRQRTDRAAQQMRAAKLKRLMDGAAIPPRFARAGLEDYQVTGQKQARVKLICERYAATWPTQRGKGGSLVLTGTTGTGKTHLACAIANRIMAEHMGAAIFTTVSDLALEVRSTYGKKSDRSEKQVLRDLMEPDLLIIDDVGTEMGAQFELRVLFDLINGRYSHQMPMILTSNLEQEALHKHLGDRMMDRLSECGTVLALDWESHRAKARAS